MNRAALVPESDRPRGFLDNWLDVHLETLSVDQLRAEMAVSAITTAELVAGPPAMSETVSDDVDDLSSRCQQNDAPKWSSTSSQRRPGRVTSTRVHERVVGSEDTILPVGEVQVKIVRGEACAGTMAVGVVSASPRSERSVQQRHRMVPASTHPEAATAASGDAANWLSARFPASKPRATPVSSHD